MAPECMHQKNNTEDNAPKTGEVINNKDDHSENEWINKGRMFQRRHSFSASANTSNENINPCEVLSEKGEEGSK